MTRWYRAPEIMLACREYTRAIDVWSVGCILAELLGRKPLFPGNDYIHQLQIIADTCGTPEEEDLHFITSEKALRFMRSQPKKPKVDLTTLFPKANPAGLDLVDKMLVFDPEKRMTIEQALEHPYLSELHHIDDEPVCPEPFDFSFEDEELDKVRCSMGGCSEGGRSEGGRSWGWGCGKGTVGCWYFRAPPVSWVARN